MIKSDKEDGQLDIFKVFSDYFTEAAGIKKFFSSAVSTYDYLLVLLALMTVVALAIYFFWPSIKRKIMNKKLIEFIYFYKKLTDDEKKLLNRLTRKYKISPEYTLYISKPDYDKIFSAELKKRLLAQQKETLIKEYIDHRDTIADKLFN